MDAAAGGRALSETIPVVFEADAGSVGRHDRQHPAIVHHGADEGVLREQGARSIELAPIEGVASRPRRQPGLPVARLAAGFGYGVAEERAGRRFAEIAPPLGFAAHQADALQEDEMGLDQLADAGVACRHVNDDLGEVAEARLRPAVTSRYARGPEAARQDKGQRFPRKRGGAVSLRGRQGYGLAYRPGGLDKRAAIRHGDRGFGKVRRQRKHPSAKHRCRPD